MFGEKNWLKCFLNDHLTTFKGAILQNEKCLFKMLLGHFAPPITVYFRESCKTCVIVLLNYGWRFAHVKEAVITLLVQPIFLHWYTPKSFAYGKPNVAQNTVLLGVLSMRAEGKVSCPYGEENEWGPS